jgi:hypothetical protein
MRGVHVVSASRSVTIISGGFRELALGVPEADEAKTSPWENPADSRTRVFQPKPLCPGSPPTSSTLEVQRFFYQGNCPGQIVLEGPISPTWMREPKTCDDPKLQCTDGVPPVGGVLTFGWT